MYRIFKSADGILIESQSSVILSKTLSLDVLFRADDQIAFVRRHFETGEPSSLPAHGLPLPAPVESQEIWASGVTYVRSKAARMEESERSGGDAFYDMVYEAERPELFFKSTAQRARGHLAGVAIRSDSDWNVPEPELTLALNAKGRVFGYTIGNDMSSRSIEGENPLYLPQAKIYRASCAIGPCLVVGADLVSKQKQNKISISIERDSGIVFNDSTDISQLKREFNELAAYLFRDNEFPDGALLMTGTGIVPDAPFTLASGDVIRIEIEGIGSLENFVE